MMVNPIVERPTNGIRRALHPGAIDSTHRARRPPPWRRAGRL